MFHGGGNGDGNDAIRDDSGVIIIWCENSILNKKNIKIQTSEKEQKYEFSAFYISQTTDLLASRNNE